MRSVSTRWTFAAALLITLLIRMVALVGDWGSLAQDDDAYGRLAVYWAESGVYGFPSESGDSLTGYTDGLASATSMRPTAYRPPFYPWLLSWLVVEGQLNLVAVALVHLWLGLASTALTYVIAMRLQVRWPIIPALAVACDPILIRGSQLVMTETLITFFALAIWALWLKVSIPVSAMTDRPSANRSSRVLQHALLGLLLGISVLTRPTMLPWAFCLVLLAAAGPLLTGNRDEERRKFSYGLFSKAAIVGGVFVLTLAPWLVRNTLVMGKAIGTTTHGGYTLLLANNPSLYNHFRVAGASRDWDADDFHKHWAARRSGDPTRASFWQSQIDRPPIDPSIDELHDDQLAQRAALATIRRAPSMFVLNCAYRMCWFWALAPHQSGTAMRWAVGTWYAVWFFAALMGIVCLGRRCMTLPWLAPAALVLTLTIIHAVYWSNMRMRAPLMPSVYIAAAMFIGCVGGRTHRA